MNIFKIVRANDWWEYKIPPLLAIAYATALLNGTPISSIIPKLLFLLSALMIGAIYVSVINDLTDVKEDLAAGKSNAMAKFSPGLRYLFPLICVLVGFVFMYWQREDQLSLTLYGMSWLVFSLYSIPPVRLKKRGFAGVLADASGAHLFPALLMVSAILSAEKNVEINLFWFATVGVWAIAYGLRGILWHQFADRENDIRSGAATYATRTSPDSFKWKEVALFTLECIALVLILSQILLLVIICSLCLYFLLLAARRIFFNAKMVMILSPAGPYHILLSDFYQFFFPISLLLADSIKNPLSLILVFAHLILFPGITKNTFKELFGAIMSLRHWIIYRRKP